MVEQEIYIDLNTFFHRLDPRTKIIMLMVTFVVDPSRA
jgi:energy-coupling factor transporter transmembrane protein EcfT